MLIRIVVDERERNSQIPKLLLDAGVRVDFAQLKVGDYITSAATAIERKTVNDLICSIYDGRLFLQCTDLNQYLFQACAYYRGQHVGSCGYSSWDYK